MTHPQTPDWPVIEAAFHAGKTLAYPTEGVWGLGCDPLSEQAVNALLALKQRPVSRGLIVLASDWSACSHWVDSNQVGDCLSLLEQWPAEETWLFPVSSAVPGWIRGDHLSVAIRLTAHPVARTLAERCGGLICSTSANVSGEPAIMDEATLRSQPFAQDCVIVSGAVGGAGAPSPIKDVLTGRYVRR